MILIWEKMGWDPTFYTVSIISDFWAADTEATTSKNMVQIHSMISGLHHAVKFLNKEQNKINRRESTLVVKKSSKRFIAFCASSDPDLVNNLSRGSPKAYQRNQQRQWLQFIRIQNSKSQQYHSPKAYYKTYKYTTFTAIYQPPKQQIVMKTFFFIVFILLGETQQYY